MLQKQALRFQSWRQFYYLLLNREEMQAKHGYDVWKAIQEEYGDPSSYLGPDSIGNWKGKKEKAGYSRLSLRHGYGDSI